MPNARLTEQRVEGYTRILGLDPLATRIGASSSADVLSRRWSRAKENRKLKQMVAELAMDKHMPSTCFETYCEKRLTPRPDHVSPWEGKISGLLLFGRPVTPLHCLAEGTARPSS